MDATTDESFLTSPSRNYWVICAIPAASTSPAAGKSFGKSRRTIGKGSNPPADASRATISTAGRGAFVPVRQVSARRAASAQAKRLVPKRLLWEADEELALTRLVTIGAG